MLRLAFAKAAAVSLLVACGGGDPGDAIFNANSANSGGAGGAGGAGGTGTQLPSPVVRYEVTGTTDAASLTFTNAQGGTQQGVAPLPWRTEFTGIANNFLYISAQNERDSGTVSVAIFVDGVRVKTSQSSGAFVIATTSATCC